jgi:hypothetical protein
MASRLRRVFVLALIVAPAACAVGTTPTGPPESAAAAAARPEPVAPLEPEGSRTLYVVRAALDPATHVVTGSARITWTNTADRDVDELFLYLHLNAFAGRDTTFMVETRGRLRGAEYGGPGSIDVTRLAIDGADVLGRVERSETWIGVRLEEPLAPGGRALVEADFAAKLPPVFVRTGWAGSFHMVAQWFPKVPVLSDRGRWELRERRANAEFFAEHADFDVTVDVPAGFVVGASGAEVRPVAPPGAGTARHRFVLRRAVDFAWTAWGGFRVLEEDVAGVALRWLYPAGAARTLERQRLGLAGALPRLIDWFGRPPYGHLTLVLVPPGAEGAGGMEYPGLVTTTSTPLFPGLRDDQEVAIHETAHQWFHALVASDEPNEPWLDEGLVEYATGLAMDAVFGAGESTISAGPLGIGYFPARHAIWRFVAPRGAVDRKAHEFESFDAYGATAYCRAALALQALEAAVGRRCVLHGLRRYVHWRRFALATADDLFRALREECGAAAADRVLIPALRAAGGLDLALEEVDVRRAAADAELIAPRRSAGERWLTSFVVRRRGAAAEVPVEVDVRFPGRTHRLRWDGRGAAARFTVQSDRPPRWILVDPERRLLLDDDLLDNGWRAADPDFADGLGDEILGGFGGLLGATF